MLQLTNNLHEKALKKVKTRNFDSALVVICTSVESLHSFYIKNVIVFSQSEARNFFDVYYKWQNGIIYTVT